MKDIRYIALAGFLEQQVDRINHKIFETDKDKIARLYFSTEPPLTLDDLTTVIRGAADELDFKWQDLKPYTKWILSRYANDSIRRWEDVEARTLYALHTFDRLKKRRLLESNERDINKLKKLSDLEDLVEKYEEEDLKSQREVNKELEEQLYENGEANLLYDSSKWKVVELNSERASCYFGRGTRWCTAGGNNNMYDEYAQQGTLTVFIGKKSTGVYQLFRQDTYGSDYTSTSVQFMDAKDEPLWVADVIPRNILDKALSDNKPTIVELIHMGYFKTWKEAYDGGWDDAGIADALFEEELMDLPVPRKFWEGVELNYPKHSVDVNVHADLVKPKIDGYVFSILEYLSITKGKMDETTFDVISFGAQMDIDESKLNECTIDVDGGGRLYLRDSELKNTVINAPKMNDATVDFGGKLKFTDCDLSNIGYASFATIDVVFNKCRVLLPHDLGLDFIESMLEKAKRSEFIVPPRGKLYDAIIVKRKINSLPNIKSTETDRSGKFVSIMTN